MQDANSTVTGTKVVAAKTAKAKTVKPNPSAALIGMKLNSASEITVNFRQGKGNVISCNEIECTGANATGRRLTVTFKSAGKELMTRRVYKEHFEKMADKFGVDL
jgi:hypothetical protein